LGFGGTKLVFDAQKFGDVDIYPEYTGTGLLVILQAGTQVRDSLGSNSRMVYDYVKEQYSHQYDMVWLPPLGFNNTHALMMRREHAQELKIRTISDLKTYLFTLQENSP